MGSLPRVGGLDTYRLGFQHGAADVGVGVEGRQYGNGRVERFLGLHECVELTATFARQLAGALLVPADDLELRQLRVTALWGCATRRMIRRGRRRTDGTTFGFVAVPGFPDDQRGDRSRIVGASVNAPASTI